MKNMRHACDIYRPLESQDDRGQEHGDTRLYQGVPCSIEPLNSRELEAARQIYATATHKVELYGDPSIPLAHKDFIKVQSRKLKIGSIRDLKQNGEQLELLCEERVA
jgi:SPP1 family predicted phage head-tail adaptor